MNTQVKNFSIVKGAQSRIVVHFNDDVDIDSIEVYGGNDKCKCRQLIYHEIRRDEHSITLLSNPAPGNCPYLPYQVFIRETTTNVEWLVLTGQVSIISRYVGCEHEIEINPPIEDEILSVDVEIVYSKADLDDAVRRAMEAAACAENQAYCASVHSATARVWSENAQGFAWDAGSSANAALNAKTGACNAAGESKINAANACQYKQDAYIYKGYACEASAAASTAKTGACNAASTAQSAVSTIDQLKTQTCQYKQQACQYKQQACQYKQTTCTYLDEVTGIAATKQDKLTAGRNITITKSGDTTYICAEGGSVEGFAKLTCNNEFTGCNKFYNTNGIVIGKNSAEKKNLKYNYGRLVWGGADIITTNDLAQSIYNCGGANQSAPSSQAVWDAVHPTPIDIYDCWFCSCNRMVDGEIYRYLVAGCGNNIGSILPDTFGTVELWIDYDCGEPPYIACPPLPFLWVDNENCACAEWPIKCWVGGTRYAFVFRNDYQRMLGNIQYCYTRGGSCCSCC